MPKHEPESPVARQYRWPWFVLAAVLLGIVLMVLWVLGAVRRVKQIKESTGHSASAAPGRDALQERRRGESAAASQADQSWTNGMVWIPAGSFEMGSDDGQPDERPVHQVSV